MKMHRLIDRMVIRIGCIALWQNSIVSIPFIICVMISCSIYPKAYFSSEIDPGTKKVTKKLNDLQVKTKYDFYNGLISFYSQSGTNTLEIQFKQKSPYPRFKNCLKSEMEIGAKTISIEKESYAIYRSSYDEYEEVVCFSFNKNQFKQNIAHEDIEFRFCNSIYVFSNDYYDMILQFISLVK